MFRLGLARRSPELAVTRGGQYVFGWSGDAFYLGRLAVQVVRWRRTVYLDWTTRSGVIRVKKIRWGAAS